MSDIAGVNGYIKLLDEIIAFRDECRKVQKNLIPLSDPSGDARLAYWLCAGHLTEIIDWHQSRLTVCN